MDTDSGATVESWRLDKPVALAVIFGAAGILLPLFTIREHRLDGGTGLSVLSASVPYSVLLAVCILVPAVIILVRTNAKIRAGLLAGTGSVLIVLPWLLAGILGSRELLELELDLGRVAPAGGFWFLTLSGMILVSEFSRRVQGWTGTLLVAAILLCVFAMFRLGLLEDIAFIREYRVREQRFLSEVIAHLRIAAMAVGSAVLVGVPAGIVSYRYRVVRKPVFSVVSGLQTIPSLALFGLMIAPLAFLSQRYPFLRQLGIRGVGNAPAIIALFLYSLLPILRNTYTSLSVIDPAVIEAGKGMGMTQKQLLFMLEIPVALPIILSGIRVASVQTIGNTTVAALIGAGGLGNFVFQGLGQASPDLIVMGVIPIVVLAIVIDRVFAFFIGRVIPGARNVE
ncbi:MAG: ABC transporter permease [Spirochaetaceae bacterium]|nr:MAG: ABC transporter permease [Spirochaetaceae bacterium]